MKIYPRLLRLAAIVGVGTLLTGCLLRPAAVATRQFVLAPMDSARGSREPNPRALAVGLGAIRMPEHLLRSTMVVRRGENEIEYLENALWAERLDRSFQLALAANLETLLPGSHIQLSAWQGGEVALAAFVRVERLDVDVHGNGTLIARWQTESPDRSQVLKSGEVALSKFGASPYVDPEASVATLSALTAQFSEILAQAIRQSATTSPAR